MGVTEAEDPNPKNEENCEYQIINYDQKSARNATPAHRSVLEWVSWKYTLSNEKLYSHQKLNRKYNRKPILVKNQMYPVYLMGTMVN